MHIFDLFNLKKEKKIIVLFRNRMRMHCLLLCVYIRSTYSKAANARWATFHSILATCDAVFDKDAEIYLHQENGCSSFQKMENAIFKNCRFYSSKNANLYFEICQFMYKRFSNKMARSRSGRWSCSSLHWQTFLREKCVHSVPKVVLIEIEDVNILNWTVPIDDCFC